MAWIALVGAAISAYGSYQQGQANAASQEYNAEVQQHNAAMARSQGVAAVDAQQRDAARRIGAMKALYGASGVQTDSGSPMDVLADSARMAALDALTTQYNYEVKAQGFGEQSSLDESAASNSRTSSYFNAAAAGLRGVSSYYGMTGSSIPSFG